VRLFLLFAPFCCALCIDRTLFRCNFLGAHHIFLGQAWAEGKRGACNVSPPR